MAASAARSPSPRRSSRRPPERLHIGIAASDGPAGARPFELGCTLYILASAAAGTAMVVPERRRRTLPPPGRRRLDPDQVSAGRPHSPRAGRVLPCCTARELR